MTRLCIVWRVARWSAGRDRALQDALIDKVDDHSKDGNDDSVHQRIAKKVTDTNRLSSSIRIGTHGYKRREQRDKECDDDQHDQAVAHEAQPSLNVRLVNHFRLPKLKQK